MNTQACIKGCNGYPHHTLDCPNNPDYAHRQWEHYNKYEQLRKELHVRFDENSLRFFNVENVDILRQHYNNDRALNTIPLRYFDAYAAIFIVRTTKRTVYTHELVCMAKHCLIYDVLGIEPPQQP